MSMPSLKKQSSASAFVDEFLETATLGKKNESALSAVKGVLQEMKSAMDSMQLHIGALKQENTDLKERVHKLEKRLAVPPNSGIIASMSVGSSPMASHCAVPVAFEIHGLPGDGSMDASVVLNAGAHSGGSGAPPLKRRKRSLGQMQDDAIIIPSMAETLAMEQVSSETETETGDSDNGSEQSVRLSAEPKTDEKHAENDNDNDEDFDMLSPVKRVKKRSALQIAGLRVPSFQRRHPSMPGLEAATMASIRKIGTECGRLLTTDTLPPTVPRLRSTQTDATMVFERDEDVKEKEASASPVSAPRIAAKHRGTVIEGVDTLLPTLPPLLKTMDTNNTVSGSGILPPLVKDEKIGLRAMNGSLKLFEMQSLMEDVVICSNAAEELMQLQRIEDAKRRLKPTYEKVSKQLNTLLKAAGESERLKLSVFACNMAICCGKLRQFEEAKKAAEMTISSRSDWHKGYSTLAALVHISDKDTGRALQLFKEAYIYCKDADDKLKMQQRIERLKKAMAKAPRGEVSVKKAAMTLSTKTKKKRGLSGNSSALSAVTPATKSSKAHNAMADPRSAYRRMSPRLLASRLKEMEAEDRVQVLAAATGSPVAADMDFSSDEHRVVSGFVADNFRSKGKLREAIRKKSKDTLQRILEVNGQKKGGKKAELMERVMEGMMHGAVPRCPKCVANGVPKPRILKYNEHTSEYFCSGYFHVTRRRTVKCGFISADVKRAKWRKVGLYL